MAGLPCGRFKGTRILMNIRRTTRHLPDAYLQAPDYASPRRITERVISYCPLTWMELEVPTPFETVTVTEAMLLSTVCPVGSVPANVNGILNVNWPPNALEAVLPNHTVETGCTLTVNC